jgi:hypothetical protein
MPEKWWEAAPVEDKSGGNWWDSAPQVAPNFPGKEASFSQGKPESAWHSAWSSVRDSMFGTPEHQQARAEGLPVDPPPSEVYGAMAEGALMLGGAEAAPMALSGARGIMGKAGRWALSNPSKTGAIIGAVPGAIRGNPREAAAGAVAGAGGGAVSRIKALRGLIGGGEAAAPSVTGTAEEVYAQAKALVAAGKTDEARAVIDAVRANAGNVAPEVAAAMPAVTQAPVVPIKPDAGRAAAGAHRRLMDFAKGIAKEDPKIGEKIWILLDDAGEPVKRLTSDEAGAAARKGQRTTWVKNLWRAGAL